MANTAGIRQAIDDAGGVVPPPRQGELLPAPAEARTTVEQPKGVGRPPGARNKRTEEFRQELAAMGALPGLFLAKLIRDYQHDRKELAQRLGVESGPLFEKVVHAAETLLPYCEQKLPVDVKVDGKGAMVFAMVDPAALIDDNGDHGHGPIRIGKIEGNQGVIDAPASGVGQSGVGQNEPSR
jgi:hypothetical protein